MGEKLKIIRTSYTEIPNETSLIIEFDNIRDLIESFKEIDDRINDDTLDDITCLVFDGPINGLQYKNYIDNNKDRNIKYGWYTKNKSMPYMAGAVNYIKMDGTLYFNDNNSLDKPRWFPIKPLTKQDLNPIDPLYFEKFEELSK